MLPIQLLHCSAVICWCDWNRWHQWEWRTGRHRYLYKVWFEQKLRCMKYGWQTPSQVTLTQRYDTRRFSYLDAPGGI